MANPRIFLQTIATGIDREIQDQAEADLLKSKANFSQIMD
jgi:hypothetical protein